jgi:superfamily II RNA helicase
LSNERYRELKKDGLDVGLVTGDVKWNPNADILCMTQEIYAQGYYTRVCDVVLDEFHYIFHNHDRARCYMESIDKSNPKSRLLLMSATVKDPTSIAKYFNNLTGRKFTVAETNDRLVPLNYSFSGIKLKDVKDAIIFCFSRSAIDKIIFELCEVRKKIDNHTIKKISDLSYEYLVEFMPEWEYGISKYHGKLLPKEKMFIEYLFRNGYIDVVVGTDALALGVNLPAMYTIIAQTYKPTNKHLNPSEFLQLAGRAGRFGYHPQGIATWLIDSPVEAKGINTKAMFDWLVTADLEQVEIEVDVDYKELLNGRHKEEEASIMLRYMYPRREKENGMFKKYLYQVGLAEEEILKYRKNFKGLLSTKDFDCMDILLKEFYLPEWDFSKNVHIAYIASTEISRSGILDFKNIIDTLLTDEMCEGEALHELLLLNKWAKDVINNNHDFFTINYDLIIERINSLDHTIFNPDFSL